MKKSKVWPEVLVSLLILRVLWDLVNQSFFPAAIGDSFQQYSLPPALPTALAELRARQPSPTPLPESTAPPPQKTTYLNISLTDSYQLESTYYTLDPEQPNGANMILIVKRTQTKQDGSTIVDYKPETFCVEVVTFLDKNQTKSTTYNKDTTTNMLIVIDKDDLKRYGVSVASLEKAYFVSNPGCSKFPALTPTP